LLNAFALTVDDKDVINSIENVNLIKNCIIILITTIS